MAKRMGTKRSAMQRLSDNINSILTASDSKREKPMPKHKQKLCKKLKLKPDPVQSFLQFKPDDPDFKTDENTSASKCKTFSKTWIPPLKMKSEFENKNKWKNNTNSPCTNIPVETISKNKCVPSATITSESCNSYDKQSTTNTTINHSGHCPEYCGSNVYTPLMFENSPATILNNYSDVNKNRLNTSTEIEDIIHGSASLTHCVDSVTESVAICDNSVSKLKFNTKDQLDQTLIIQQEAKDTSNNFEDILTKNSINESENMAKLSDTYENNHVQPVSNVNKINKEHSGEKEICNDDETMNEHDIQNISAELKICESSQRNDSKENIHVVSEIDLTLESDESGDEEMHQNSQKWKSSDENYELCTVKANDVFFTCKTEYVPATYAVENEIIVDSVTINPPTGDNASTQQSGIDAYERSPDDTLYSSQSHKKSSSMNRNYEDEQLKNNKNQSDMIDCFARNVEEFQKPMNDFSENITGFERSVSDTIKNKLHDISSQDTIIIEENSNLEIDKLKNPTKVELSTLNRCEEIPFHKPNSEKSISIDSYFNSTVVQVHNSQKSGNSVKDRMLPISNIENLQENIVVHNSQTSENSVQERMSQISNIENLQENMVVHNSQKSNNSVQDRMSQISNIENLQENKVVHNLQTSNNSLQDRMLPILNTENLQEHLVLVENEICETKNPVTPVKSKKYDDLIECSDEFFDIPMSQFIKIENDFNEITQVESENKLKNVVANKDDKCITTNSSKTSQNQSTAPTHNNLLIRPPKLDWIKKLNEEKQRLRSIIQEINSLNSTLLQARKEIWPEQFVVLPKK